LQDQWVAKLVTVTVTVLVKADLQERHLLLVSSKEHQLTKHGVLAAVMLTGRQAAECQGVLAIAATTQNNVLEALVRAEAALLK
jgi:hypothetical protein